MSSKKKLIQNLKKKKNCDTKLKKKKNHCSHKARVMRLVSL